jgi:phage tail-like protein
MAIFRETPYGDYNFLVDLGQGDPAAVQAGFAEVVLPEGYVDVIEYRNGNEKESGARKIPGRAKYNNVILKRGVIGSLDLYQWWDQIRNGDATGRRTVSIQLLNEDRTAAVLTWKLLRAFPVRYKFSNLDARGQAPLLEMLELAYERFEIE